MVQHTQVNRCNKSHKRTVSFFKKKSHNHLNRAEEKTSQNQIFLHDKSPRESKTKRNMPQQTRS